MLLISVSRAEKALFPSASVCFLARFPDDKQLARSVKSSLTELIASVTGARVDPSAQNPLRGADNRGLVQ